MEFVKSESSESGATKLQSNFSPEIPFIQFYEFAPSTEVEQRPLESWNNARYENSIEKYQWVRDYSADIYEVLREAELKRKKINPRSTQKGYRTSLITLINDIAEFYKLSCGTRHLAVYMLDYFMDFYTICKSKLELTAVTCLIVAGKVEDLKENTPRFTDVNAMMGYYYTLDEFRSLERRLLLVFDFELQRPTAATFSEYFSNYLVTRQEFLYWSLPLDYQSWYGIPLEQSPPLYSSYEDMATSVSRLLNVLIDESLFYAKFSNVRPSELAAACIAAARYFSYIIPTWTPYLEKATQCTLDVIKPILRKVIDIHSFNLHEERSLKSKKKKYFGSPDSGIVADMQSNMPDYENVSNEGLLCTESLSNGKRKYLEHYHDDDTSDDLESCLLEKKIKYQ